MVDNGEFREDLLYRINTIHIEIPSLRERKEDIIPLAERFMIRFCKQYDKEPMKFSSAAKEKLSIHPWYGNIRELEHVIEKVVIINDEPLIPAEILQLSSRKIESPERNISTFRRYGETNDTESIGGLCRKFVGSSHPVRNYPADTL